jgi:diadenosine tetraphosphate (Ap4A) HIT family hydrolase
MALIYETQNFLVEAFDTPHVTRTDGGHIRIYPRKKVMDRTELSPKLAIELMRLTMVVGEAMTAGLTKRGIVIMRINYQDMGNWAFKKKEKPFFHLHVYGRAKTAKYQPYCEAVQLPDRSTGFYDNFEPLNKGDIKEIRRQIELLFQKDKYKDSNWKLS